MSLCKKCSLSLDNYLLQQVLFRHNFCNDKWVGKKCIFWQGLCKGKLWSMFLACWKSCKTRSTSLLPLFYSRKSLKIVYPSFKSNMDFGKYLRHCLFLPHISFLRYILPIKDLESDFWVVMCSCPVRNCFVESSFVAVHLLPWQDIYKGPVYQ